MKTIAYVRRAAGALALAGAFTGCASVDLRAASLPEPPAWNTIEMFILDTEIVSIERHREHSAS